MQRSQWVTARRKGLCGVHRSTHTLLSGSLWKAEEERPCTCALQSSSFW